MSGIVIVDADCLKFLEDPQLRDRVTRSLSVARFQIVPSLINLVEIAKNESQPIAKRGFRTIEALGAETGVLPLPDEVLRETGRALLRGESRYVPKMLSASVALDDSGSLSAEFRLAAQHYANVFEAKRVQHFARWRERIRQRIKLLAKEPTDATEFLSRFWDGTASQSQFAEMVWKELNIGDFPGLEVVMNSPAWRLFLGAEGHALFERLAVHAQPPGTAGFIDLSQLSYVGAGDRAILVTNDRGLRRAAGVLFQRYTEQRWVEDWPTFERHH